MRIGHGIDAHAFKDGRQLVLGGVTIPFQYGLAAHSDGDVLLHALCDALLGAGGFGDLGRYFPDSDPQLEGVDSRVLLREVVGVLARESYRVANVDITVVAEAPKLAPHVDSIRRNIAQDLAIPAERINVKATTTEGLGFTGRGQGIAAFAVVLLE